MGYIGIYIYRYTFITKHKANLSVLINLSIPCNHQKTYGLVIFWWF